MPLLLCIACLYSAMSLLTFTAYGIDKHQSRHNKRRIRERTLHLLELAGGWPGAALAQLIFHHKRRKLTYMLLFAGIVILHLAAWAAYLWITWRP